MMYDWFKMTEDKLQRTTRLFGQAYARANRAETLKQKYQTRFFKLVTQELSKRQLPTKIIDLPTGEEPNEYVKRFHPGWKFIAASKGKIQVERDPAFMKYTYVNEADGKVYGRTVASGKPFVDVEALQDCEPDLWKEISEWEEPLATLLRTAINYGIDIGDQGVLRAKGYSAADKDFEFFMWEMEAPRVLKKEADLTSEQLGKLQRYILPAKLSVRLVAPRDAKPDELFPEEDE